MTRQIFFAYYISEKLNTPFPLGAVFVAATAVGTAASVAGLALQGAQHSEYIGQLPEQKKLLALQTKLTEHQLEQYETAKKQEEMFKTPATLRVPRPPPLPMQLAQNAARTLNTARTMTTRSLARMGTLGTELTPRADFQGHINQAFELQPPRALPAAYRRPVTNEMATASRRIRFESPGEPFTRRVIDEATLPSMRRQIRFDSPARLSPQFLRPMETIRLEPLRAARIDAPIVGPRFNAGRLSRAIGQRVRRMLPNVRHKRGTDTVRLIEPTAAELEHAKWQYRVRHPTMYKIAKFVKKHKRKLIVGAAGTVLGAAVIAGGLVGGLSKKAENVPFASDDMREGNSGVLGQIVKGGGGGGGGGGSFAQGSYYAPSRRAAGKRRRGKSSKVKRLSGKRKKAGKKVGKRRKGVSRMFGKRKRINKGKKKVGKKKRFAAF